MATAKPKTKCSTCGKEARTYSCEGCSQNFCSTDLTKHLQALRNQLDQIENDHDELRKNVIDQKGDPKHRPLIQQIDQWEKDSIKKIEQLAKECRETLTTHTNKFIIEIEKKLNDIAGEITQTRKENEFNETDLDEFKEKLKKLVKEIDKPPNISIERSSTSLINKISVVLHSEIKKNPEATAVSVLPKPDQTKVGVSYTTKEVSSKTKEAAKYNTKPEDQDFATPGTYKALRCKGRLCAKCGKCRDWYFTGDMETWHWIRNIKSWKKDDHKRWSDDRIYERFKRREGATCLDLLDLGLGDDDDDFCLCENIVQS